MSRDVEFLAADVPVSEAAVMMGELEVGAVPVGTADRLEGVVTDRDILYRVVAKGLDCSVVRVREVMTRPVFACGEDDSVQAAMDLMASHHIRRMPVRDAQGLVVGWITLGDLSRRLLLDSGHLQQALREVTEEPA
ncbi:CBS domain-containing protein [Falsiroseomonas sp. E2-1-a20]|uniref:CBS domain-containing protein n=1 Tax=Falsiroseomonas sp. E2-1-a20 TaxID=3239300 RepID=UPI003F3192C4